MYFSSCPVGYVLRCSPWGVVGRRPVVGIVLVQGVVWEVLPEVVGVGREEDRGMREEDSGLWMILEVVLPPPLL